MKMFGKPIQTETVQQNFNLSLLIMALFSVMYLV